MEKSSATRYQSVKHHDEVNSGSDEYNSGYAYRMRGVGTMDSDHSSTGFRLAPPTVEDDTTFLQRCNSFWISELAACVISLACLGVIVWTLVHFDDQPRTTWPFSVEPAAFLSTFVTISRVTMLIGVAAGLAQLRWLYYLGGPRRLDHLDTFDSASRGSWGSFMFFVRADIQGIAPTIARFGALIMIVALAMDPFTQQIIKYVSQLDTVSDADGAWVLATDRVVVDTTGNTVLSNTARRAATYGGILGFNYSVPYQCVSGNCTWPDFGSLGYSVTCRNVSDEVKSDCAARSGVLGQNCTSIRHVLPASNLSLILQNGTLVQGSNISKIYSLLVSNTTDANPAGLKSPLAFSFVMAQLLAGQDFSSINVSLLRSPSWNLTACDVKYAGKIYSGLEVINGAFQDHAARTIDIIPLANSSCWTNPSAMCQEFTYANTSVVPKGSSSIYRIELDDTPFQVRGLLNVNENLTVTGNTTQEVGSVPGGYSLAVGLFWNINITAAFNNAERYLTDFGRSFSAPHRVGGEVKTWTPYIKVRWRWFTLPAALDLLGPIFLLSVIVYTWIGVNGERLIWKAHTIPLLMHGLEGYHRSGYAGAETTAAIFRKAEEMTVQLKRNNVGEMKFVRTVGYTG